MVNVEQDIIKTFNLDLNIFIWIICLFIGGIFYKSLALIIALTLIVPDILILTYKGESND